MPKVVSQEGRIDNLPEMRAIRTRLLEIYHKLSYRMRPRHPYVLVWVIPKQRMYGSLVLPDTQNKPNYEGLVLDTYEPFYREFEKTDLNESQPPHFDSAHRLVQEGQKITYKEKYWYRSDLKPGDGVIFPHFEGVPVPRMDGGKGEIRLIDEQKIVAMLEYENASTKERLAKLVEAHDIKFAGAYSPTGIGSFVDSILEKAEVIFHEEAQTQSGK